MKYNTASDRSWQRYRVEQDKTEIINYRYCYKYYKKDRVEFILTEMLCPNVFYVLQWMVLFWIVYLWLNMSWKLSYRLQFSWRCMTYVCSITDVGLFLLRFTGSVLVIVADLQAEKPRSRVTISHKANDFFHFSKTCGRTLTQNKYPSKRVRGTF